MTSRCAPRRASSIRWMNLAVAIEGGEGRAGVRCASGSSRCPIRVSALFQAPRGGMRDCFASSSTNSHSRPNSSWRAPPAPHAGPQALPRAPTGPRGHDVGRDAGTMTATTVKVPRLDRPPRNQRAGSPQPARVGFLCVLPQVYLGLLTCHSSIQPRRAH